MNYKNLLVCFMLSLASSSLCLATPSPITLDSRIKTLVYSENEVFRIVVHYGYQTVIEFAKGEEVQTLSVGNNYAWQLTPLDRRLFIRPLEDNIVTNMTVITNKHTYQFEVQSKTPSYTRDDELVYVVRFFYPDDTEDKILPAIEEELPKTTPPISKPFNYNYTLSGPSRLAPVEVFDDGTGTFFKFKNSGIQDLPRLQLKTYDGSLIDLTPYYRGKYIYVNSVGEEIIISHKKEIVHVYNEEYNQNRG